MARNRPGRLIFPLLPLPLNQCNVQTQIASFALSRRAVQNSLLRLHNHPHRRTSHAILTIHLIFLRQTSKIKSNESITIEITWKNDGSSRDKETGSTSGHINRSCARQMCVYANRPPPHLKLAELPATEFIDHQLHVRDYHATTLSASTRSTQNITPDHVSVYLSKCPTADSAVSTPLVETDKTTDPIVYCRLLGTITDKPTSLTVPF